MLNKINKFKMCLLYHAADRSLTLVGNLQQGNVQKGM